MTVYQCLVELNELGYLKPLFLRHQINHFFLHCLLSEITLHGEIVCSAQRHAINNHF